MEKIINKNQIFALIIRSKDQFIKNGVDFKTQDRDLIQVGFLKHKSKHKIKPHIHKRKERKLNYCTEVLIIKTGKVKIIFYDEKGKDIKKSKILNKNDLIILFKGGHGFEILKKTEIIEVKQGPYLKNKDKKLFHV